MRALVISDTHGNFDLALKACSMAKPFDTVIHLGDGSEDAELLRHVLDVSVINVAGNCDIGSPAPRELIWECEGRRLMAVHGDAYRVKGGLERLELRGIETGVDAVLFGHTHIAEVTTRSGITFVNPGTLIHPSQQPSFALLEISASSISAKLFQVS